MKEGVLMVFRIGLKLLRNVRLFFLESSLKLGLLFWFGCSLKLLSRGYFLFFYRNFVLMKVRT